MPCCGPKRAGEADVGARGEEVGGVAQVGIDRRRMDDEANACVAEGFFFRQEPFESEFYKGHAIASMIVSLQCDYGAL